MSRSCGVVFRMAKILVVEDDVDFALTVEHALQTANHTVEMVHDGGSAMEYLRQSQYDIIILDWQLPDMEGIDILSKFRARGGATPVLMLTGKSQIRDKEVGLDGGADDYLTKPFDSRELVARIRALLRRQSVAPSSTLCAGDVVLDPNKHRLTKAGKEVHLQPRDFSLLEFLMRHPDEIFSAEALLTRVWHQDSDASSAGLRAAIVRIRKVIDTDGDDAKSLIENVARVGYRMRG